MLDDLGILINEPLYLPLPDGKYEKYSFSTSLAAGPCCVNCIKSMPVIKNPVLDTL